MVYWCLSKGYSAGSQVGMWDGECAVHMAPAPVQEVFREAGQQALIFGKHTWACWAWQLTFFFFFFK